MRLFVTGVTLQKARLGFRRKLPPLITALAALVLVHRIYSVAPRALPSLSLAVVALGRFIDNLQHVALVDSVDPAALPLGLDLIFEDALELDDARSLGVRFKMAGNVVIPNGEKRAKVKPSFEFASDEYRPSVIRKNFPSSQYRRIHVLMPVGCTTRAKRCNRYRETQ
jgi:hypothetical protein